MDLLITEHKSNGTLNPIPGHTVRVFVNGDFDYGYFVDEKALFSLLSSDQQRTYLNATDVLLDVEPGIAQKVIDMGRTVLKHKPKVA